MKRTAATLIFKIKRHKIEVLLVKEAKTNKWSLPKGQVKRTETIKKAALRETFEETGIELGNARSLGALPSSPGRTLHCYMAKAPAGVVPEPNASDVREAKFVSIEKARRLVNNAQRQFIEIFFKRIVA